MLRVVKVGGSLLAWGETPAALRRWLAARPPAVNLLVPGGGEVVEALRRFDRAHGLSPAASHELAIRALGVTARALAAILPEATWWDTWNQPPPRIPPTDSVPTRAATMLVADLSAALRRAWLTALPASWDVTSDTLAAAAAADWIADELVLLKSCELRSNPPATLAAAAERGIVDRHFPAVAAPLPRVSLVNLRDEHFAEVAWAAAGR